MSGPSITANLPYLSRWENPGGRINITGMSSNLALVQPANSASPSVGVITAGVTPAALALTPNGRYAYVANNNNYSLTGADAVTVIDLAAFTVATTIYDPSFNGAYTVTSNNSGSLIYITNSTSTTVSIIDTSSNTVTGVINGFNGPSGFAITPDGRTAYVNNYGAIAPTGSGLGTTVSVVNLQSNTITDTITVGLAPATLAVTPNGSFVYVANYVDGLPNHGTISVIQTSTNTVVATIGGFFGPFGIAMTPNGQQAYVTNFGSNNFSPYGTTVSVVNLANNAIVATINVGIQPSGIAITADGTYAYVANYNTLYASPGFTGLTAGQGTVNIIDLSDNQVISPTIPVGQSPAGIALGNGYGFVANFTSNTVSYFSLGSNT